MGVLKMDGWLAKGTGVLGGGWAAWKRDGWFVKKDGQLEKGRVA